MNPVITNVIIGESVLVTICFFVTMFAGNRRKWYFLNFRHINHHQNDDPIRKRMETWSLVERWADRLMWITGVTALLTAIIATILGK